MFPVYCDTQVEVRSCILRKSALRAGDVRFPKLVVEGGCGYFRRGDDQKACSLGQSGASRRGGAMPLRAFLGGLLPRMGTACTEYSTPMAEKRRPTHSVFSVYCGTPVEVRSCILGKNALRASVVLFAKRVANVDIGYFRRGDEYKACSLGRRHASPGSPCRFATPHGAECIGGEIPTAKKRR